MPLPNLTLPRRRTVYAALAALAAIAAAIAGWRWHEASTPASHLYAGAAPAACPTAATARTTAMTAAATGTSDTRLPGFTVRTPANYDPHRPHPLLVVYSPAGLGGRMTEFFTGLTPAATAAGLVVAYVDSRRLSRGAIESFARIPAAVAAGWCIDPARITVTGHSDGGTIAEAVALLPTPGSLPPAAVAASAAGIQGSDFKDFQCPVRADVLVAHGRRDTHFPGYGASAATAWAGCLGCRGAPVPDADGCLAYRNCAGGGLRYCEGDGSHLDWPATLNDRIIALALGARR